jgi:hypothetical protein
MTKSIRIAFLAAVFATLVSAPALAAGPCPNGRSSDAAMWYSIAHPGLGEYFLQGWGPWERIPELKFYLGFIPGFGWPGYLQIKSAVDASKCRTNDDLWKW